MMPCLTRLFSCQNACKAKLEGIQSELKHTDKEIKQLQPELRKVRRGACTKEHTYADLGFVVK